MGVLPVEKSVIEDELSKYITLIYGRPKIGKSPLCQYFNNALFIDTENRLKHLSVSRVGTPNWEKFLEVCRDIAKGDHKFETIIIDTADRLVEYCSDYICRENSIDYPGDMPHGKGWSLVTRELKRALSKLSTLPYGLVLTAHSKQEEIETKTKKHHRWTVNISGKNGDAIVDMVDIILFMDSVVKDGDEVGVIRTKSSAYWDAGDGTKRLPESIEYPIDKPEVAYNKIVSCFTTKKENV